MGTRFKYISDDVLSSSGEIIACHCCGIKTKCFYMFIDDGSDDPPSEICESCLKTVPSDWLEKYDEASVYKMGRERYPDKKDRKLRSKFYRETIEAYRRTPTLPNLVNWGKWPVCCLGFTEYIGDAGIDYSGSYDDFHWYGPDGHCDSHLTVPEIASLPNLDELDPFSLFRCLECGRKYWIHNV